MEEKTCGSCRFFIQHYRKETFFEKVYCGHCTHKCVRNKKPDDAACAHHEERTDAEKAE